KGLEFPCVIVVDDWKEKERAPRGPAVFYAGAERRLDVASALTGVASTPVVEAVLAADNQEFRRLLYVALTRPRHQLCVIRKTDGADGVMQAVITNPPPLRDAADLPRLPARWRPTDEAGPPIAPAVAPLPSEVMQTYRRTSFSGPVAAAARAAPREQLAPGRGHDEAVPDAGDSGPGEPAADERPSQASGGPTHVETPELASFPIPDLPAGTAFGSAVHEIFEGLDIDPAADATARVAAVTRAVGDVATSNVLRPHHGPLAAMITATLETPFGGPATAAFRDLRFADFAAADRLAELDFEMGLAGLTAGVRASDVGRVLAANLPAGDRLAGYARLLAGPAFDIPLAGLINGSIDVVLRLPGRPADDPLLVIADYKTNRLHRRDEAVPLAAYAPSRLVAAMEGHHYPLQALVYGTAVYRLLRWRLGPVKPAGWDPGECIAGVVYGFTRGMHGPTTPVDHAGHRYGVFAWVPPTAIWRRLSDLLAGKRMKLSP
ncbi:MAG: hypothetical protein ACKO1M_13805, partial [Planctomycetota bacterium]